VTSCDTCHAGAPARAKDQWPFPGNWLANSGTYPAAERYCEHCHDATPSQVQTVDGTGGVLMTAPDKSSNYTAGGHGRTTAFVPTGNPAPSYACAVCHDRLSAHIDNGAVQTDRLPGGLTNDTACDNCHLVGQAAGIAPYNRDATVEASDHASSVKSHYAGNTAYNYTCVACHDPHGTTNIAMINTTIVDGMGVAALNVSLTAETGLDGASPDDGVCDRCHQDAALPHAGTSKPGNHNQGQVCITCHQHAESFFAGCADCHGGATVSVVTQARNYWPDGAVAPDRGGSHADHINDLSRRIYGVTATALLDDPANDDKQRHLCKYCHGADPGNDADHGVTLPADVPALHPIWDAANPPLASDDGIYAVGPGTCSTTDCHYNTSTPGWYSATAATCTTCHNNGTNDGVLANAWPDLGAPGTGDHFAHFTALGAEFTSIYGAGGVCLACHNAGSRRRTSPTS